MARVLVYYAHPGQQYSHANAAMAQKARTLDGITFVDLYAEYPRFDINIDREQDRLNAHDVIVFQYPLFWYSSPSLIKEWLDLVLEHGFAYGAGGDKLVGKRMMLALTTAGSETAYSQDGYQNFPLRTFVTPMEQTATLCGMAFLPPYVLYGALQAQQNNEIAPHADGYALLLSALRDDIFDEQRAKDRPFLTATTLPLSEKV